MLEYAYGEFLFVAALVVVEDEFDTGACVCMCLLVMGAAGLKLLL
jgi:hypothetical protein